MAGRKTGQKAASERKVGMLIDDAEITERFGADVLPALDADPATRAYQPYWHGARYRPAVEKKLSAQSAI